MATAYEQGFIKRASELGYDGQALLKLAALISADGTAFTLGKGKTLSHVAREWNATHPGQKLTVQQLMAANGGLAADRYRAGKAYKMPAPHPVPHSTEVAPAVPEPEPPPIPGGVTEFTFATPENPDAPFLVNGKPPSAEPPVKAEPLKAVAVPPKPAEPVKPIPAAPASGPVGYRQNNPGNLRSDGRTRWNGAVGSTPAGKFLTFDTPASGIRAMTRILYNYGKKHGINTLEGAISRYAPSSENNTPAYLAAVRKQTGFRPGQKLDLTSEDTLQRLVPAMGAHEIGGRYFGRYDPSVVSNAVSSAFPTRKVSK